MILLRQWAQCLRQMRIHLGLYRKLSMICLHDLSFNSYNISKIRLFEHLIGLFTDDILTNINLNLSVDILNMHEAGLSLTSLRHDTSRNFHCQIFFFQLFLRTVFICCTYFSGFVCSLICMPERLDAHGTQIFHFLSTDNFLFS